MNVSSLTVGAAILTLLLIVRKTRIWISQRKYRQWARENGCGDVPALPNILPGGLEHWLVRYSSRLDKLDFAEDVARRPFTRMGRYAFRVNNLFSASTIISAHPTHVKTVFSTKEQDFEYGPIRGDSLKAVAGAGIFTTEGAEWKHFRRQLKPYFARENISNLSDIERHLQILFKALPNMDKTSGWTSGEVDLVPLLHRFTMDTITELLFGESVNSQTTAMTAFSGNVDTDFAAAVDYTLEFVVWRARLDIFWWITPSSKFQRAVQTVRSFVSHYVESALESNSLAKPAQKSALLDDLIAETKNPIELRDQVLQLLLAGRNTTAALLSHALLFLARNPKEYANARAEVLAFYESGTPMTFETLKACKVLNYILHETLRLLPIAALGLQRRAKRDTTLPYGGGPDETQPIALRKNELIRFSYYTMYRRPDIWGSDAEEFRPSRWKDRRMGSDFFPFSTGPRVCIGQQLALTEASYVVARMLMTYDQMEHVDAHLPIKTKFSLLLAVEGGVKLRLHKAIPVR